MEPVGDITRFDECLYTVGVREPRRLRVPRPGGGDRRGAALVLRPRPRAPAVDLMAFPGEEPPQIECNEDAGGQDTEE